MQKKKRDRIKSGTHIVQARRDHPDGMKICGVCGTAKTATIENFIPFARGYLGLKSECRECSYRQVRARREKNWAARLREYTYGRHSQRWKNEKYDLTQELIMQMWAQQNGKCAWFGVEMTTEMGSLRSADPRLVTLDRLDCDRGYTSDNVALVCKAANQARGDTPLPAFHDFVQEIKRN